MAKRSKILIAIVSSVFVFALLFVVKFFTGGSSMDAIHLTHENEIRDACSRFLIDGKSNSATSSASLAKLEEVMVKLRDGWPGIARDSYYPHEFTSHDLLGSIYWDVAKSASNCDSVLCKENLIQLLEATAPKSKSKSKSKLSASYMYAIENHDLSDFLGKTKVPGNVSDNDQ